MKSDVELLKQRREIFLRERTEQEIMVKEWADRLYKADPDKIVGIIIPENLSLRTLIPELYEDNPREDVYEEQYKRAQDFISTINRIADKHNEEAIRCLREYEELKSRVR